jgi:glycosyltransferase involved in cell wall biosynthesis
MVKFGLIIPIRNEVWSIPHLKEYASVADEIIFIDGNSNDGTVEAIRKSFPESPIICQSNEKGKGHAIILGLMATKAEIVMQLDADLPISVKEIIAIKQYMESNENVDMIKLSRHLPGGGSSDLTQIRRVGAKFLAFVARKVHKVNWTEICYAMWTIKMEKIEVLKLDQLLSRKRTMPKRILSYGHSFEFDQYCYFKFLQADCKIIELPTMEHARLHGKSSLSAPRDGIRTLLVILIEKSKNLRKIFST